MSQPAGFNLERLIGRIDRRLVYLGLFVFTLYPMVAGKTLPLYPSPPAQALATTIDQLPPDKVVFIASDWDAGTQAESRPQLMAIVRHLIRRNLKFAVYAVGAQTGPQLAQEVITRAIELEHAEGRYLYGQQWCNLGYKLITSPWLRTFSRSIPDAMKGDWKNVPYNQIPMLKGVERFGPDGQVSMLIDVTASATNEAWLQYIGPTKAKLGFAVTAVMGPEQYQYLDSGQLNGLLIGMKGAAEYERIINAPGFGLSAMTGQSFAHLYIFLLIVLGNVSVLIGWLNRRSR